MEGIRVCLVLSRDGLPLGVHPGEAEGRAKEAWSRLHGAGDPHRGFLDLGEEILAISRRGPYVAVAVAAPGVLPGVILDALDSNLNVAEEEHARQSVGEPEPAPPPAKPVRRRRSVRQHAAAARRTTSSEPSPAPEPRVSDVSEAAHAVSEDAVEGPLAADGPAPEVSSVLAPQVDRAALVREFGKLLADPGREE